MIIFKNLSNETPYIIFKQKYHQALNLKQNNIEAISISSYDKKNSEVDSRFVNLKFIDGNKFIFFSNYNSPKSRAFSSFNQISALFYWSTTNVQIRMKAKIQRTPTEYNNKYFRQRSLKKNALSISSNQSQNINSFRNVMAQYHQVLESEDLSQCPNYWGGFSFIPYYFEFWDGHESRLNKREAYKKIDDGWKHSILQP